jgi:hypothetical protein
MGMTLARRLGENRSGLCVWLFHPKDSGGARSETRSSLRGLRANDEEPQGSVGSLAGIATAPGAVGETEGTIEGTRRRWHKQGV